MLTLAAKEAFSIWIAYHCLEQIALILYGKLFVLMLWTTNFKGSCVI